MPTNTASRLGASNGSSRPDLGEGPPFPLVVVRVSSGSVFPENSSINQARKRSQIPGPVAGDEPSVTRIRPVLTSRSRSFGPKAVAVRGEVTDVEAQIPDLLTKRLLAAPARSLLLGEQFADLCQLGGCERAMALRVLARHSRQF